MVKFERKYNYLWKIEYLENIREYVYVISDGGTQEKYMILDWSLLNAIEDFKRKMKTQYGTNTGKSRKTA